MKRVTWAEVPEQEQRSPGGTFQSFSRNLVPALGGRQGLGVEMGGWPFDVQTRRIPPGKSVCPFHCHLAQWELFLVQAGEGSVRAGDQTYAVRTGDVFVHPPGEAHALRNSGASDLSVLIIADNPPMDGCYYPDSQKWALRPPGWIFRAARADYFEGEEPGPIDAARAASPPPIITPPVTSFSQRLVHCEDLPWGDWSSPQGKFRGTSKELSVAVGAQRNTPSGMGGHPFDLELGKFPPGYAGSPFHFHTNQWELFMIQRGQGSVRTAGETLTVGPGDVILQEPGDPHQLRNSGTEDLVYLLVADNPSTDVWHYPDSGKWGLKSPRKFFRMTEVDYWDGEE